MQPAALLTVGINMTENGMSSPEGAVVTPERLIL